MGLLFVSADVVRGKKVTSYVAIKDDSSMPVPTGSMQKWSPMETLSLPEPRDLVPFSKAILAALEG